MQGETTLRARQIFELKTDRGQQLMRNLSLRLRLKYSNSGAWFWNVLRRVLRGDAPALKNRFWPL